MLVLVESKGIYKTWEGSCLGISRGVLTISVSVIHLFGHTPRLTEDQMMFDAKSRQRRPSPVDSHQEYGRCGSDPLC